MAMRTCSPVTRMFRMVLKRIIVAMLSSTFCAVVIAEPISRGVQAGAIASAAFNKDGSLILPKDFRRWAHVGTRVQAIEKSMIDVNPALGPQVVDSYVEPNAYDAYTKSGIWLDGTRIIKEIGILKTGNGCDKVSYVCSTRYGAGLLQDRHAGLGMMIKDKVRFPNEPGNWSYFRFVWDGAAYQPTAVAMPRVSCVACHIKMASDTNFVFTNTQVDLLSRILE